MILDFLYFIAFVLLGLATVRTVGIALNARDRRRHDRCLRNIERLEIANGYREAPLAVRADPLYDFFPARYPLLFDLAAQQQATVIELAPGAPAPVFHPPTHMLHDRGLPKVFIYDESTYG